jgi:hypothetical protein
MIAETKVQPIPAIAGCRRFGLQIRSVIPGRHPAIRGRIGRYLARSKPNSNDIGMEFAALHHEGN